MANNNAAAQAGTPQATQTGGGGNKSAPSGKPGNVLPLWGNEKTMNLNPMILTNILSSPYFKVQLYELKTYHEVVDEIYFKVNHVEPWEKGSRKTAGQTGMCGGVSTSTCLPVFGVLQADKIHSRSSYCITYLLQTFPPVGIECKWKILFLCG